MAFIQTDLESANCRDSPPGACWG